MGPPLRSFAADAHDCIMVWVLGPTGYKVVARLIRAQKRAPSDRHPDRSKRAIVLEAVKVWPGNGGACRKVGATANLDSSCARRRKQSAGRDEETGFQIEQRNRRKDKRRAALVNSLTKKAPYKEIAVGCAAAARLGLWGFSDERRGAEVGQERLGRWGWGE